MAGGRRAPCGGAHRHAGDGGRFPRPARLRPDVGPPELFLDRAVAAAGAVGRTLADPGCGADPVVAAQARHRADDREFRRPDGDRPRYHRVPVHDLSGSALVGRCGRAGHAALDGGVVVARSVSHPPPAVAGLRLGLSRWPHGLFDGFPRRSLARLFRRRLCLEIRPVRGHRGLGFHSIRIHGVRCGRRRASEDAARQFLPSGPATAQHRSHSRRVRASTSASPTA